MIITEQTMKKLITRFGAVCMYFKAAHTDKETPMGMFDRVRVYFEGFPDEEYHNCEFQTKEFLNMLAEIEITAHGDVRYVKDMGSYTVRVQPTANFRFYTADTSDKGNIAWVEYEAHIMNGRVIRITRTENHWKGK